MTLARRFTSMMLLLVATGLSRADTVLTYRTHADGFEMMGQKQGPVDGQHVIWIARDRARQEVGDVAFIVRRDKKKAFLVNRAAKTYSAFDVPLDPKKMLPPEAVTMMEQMAARMQMTAKVVPSEERKKIGKWDTRRYDVTLTSAMGMNVEVTVWASESIPVEPGIYRELTDGMSTLEMGTAEMLRELDKIPGVPVLEETRTTVMGSTLASRDELVSVEQKTSPASGYDVPVGCKLVPFNPFAAKEGGPVAAPPPAPAHDSKSPGR